jgi:pimeloyl-ACP methyl ester carboxylesterase
LVWGDSDGVVGRDMQDVLEARIVDAMFVAYPGVGHTPRWEEPQRFADDLATFCRAMSFPRP